MTNLKRVEVRCQHCNRWFATGMKFPQDSEFEPEVFVGMLKECPFCGRDTHFTKENMRVRPAREEPSGS